MLEKNPGEELTNFWNSERNAYAVESTVCWHKGVKRSQSE